MQVPVVRTVDFSCTVEGSHFSAGGHVSIDFVGQDEQEVILQWNGEPRPSAEAGEQH